ncbi:hypothetical protein ARMGADRAFT_1079345 [Armillaria gallica]|uniref:Uncharacterized protein n=1 Tax=Armillaria gallica TaxID=47427 RepID=A0A2H3DF53_ARMGA|nr:hypothetical protein ARMGADRAFT_1079345 [Armillaria gallica]
MLLQEKLIQECMGSEEESNKQPGIQRGMSSGRGNGKRRRGRKSKNATAGSPKKAEDSATKAETATPGRRGHDTATMRKMILFVSALKCGHARHSGDPTHFPWYSQQPTSDVGRGDPRRRSKTVSSEDLEKPGETMKNIVLSPSHPREGERMSADSHKTTSGYSNKNLYLTHSKSPPSSWASSELAARSSKDTPNNLKRAKKDTIQGARDSRIKDGLLEATGSKS